MDTSRLNVGIYKPMKNTSNCNLIGCNSSERGKPGLCVKIMFLIELLELHDLEEDVLQDVFGISLIFIQLPRHPQDVPTLPHVEL